MVYLPDTEILYSSWPAQQTHQSPLKGALVLVQVPVDRRLIVDRHLVNHTTSNKYFAKCFLLVGEKTTHFDDSLGFRTLFNHFHIGPAISLIVPDVVGHLSGSETLIAIALTARPVVDILLLHKVRVRSPDQALTVCSLA